MVVNEEGVMELIFVYVIFALIVGFAAGSMGRSGFLWFLLALLTTPLFSGIFLLLAGSNKRDPNRPNPWTHIKCPDCKELILKDARVCKHCGCRLRQPN